MNETSLILIIFLAALIHAGFQLSVSTLSLMSGHAITKNKSQARLMTLMTAFIFGAVTMTILMLSTIAFLIELALQGGISYELIWAISVGLSFTVGVAVWIFYYNREENGTSLWLPRSLASYITRRTKRTKNSGEAFTLGLVSVLAEFLFISTPLIIVALAILQLTPALQLGSLFIYTLVSSASLVIVWSMVGSGHSLSKIQHWRENNKRFLQFISGAALIVLGLFIYVNELTLPVTFLGGIL